MCSDMMQKDSMQKDSMMKKDDAMMKPGMAASEPMKK
jgi:hypothetical protein